MNRFIFLLSLLLISVSNATCASDSQSSLEITHWDFDAIKASHIVYPENNSIIKKQCSPSLENIAWFNQQSDNSIFSSDDCFVYTTSKNGWITKVNTQTKQVLAKTRVGLMTVYSKKKASIFIVTSTVKNSGKK